MTIQYWTNADLLFRVVEVQRTYEATATPVWKVPTWASYSNN